jgi:hypothetical protein
MAYFEDLSEYTYDVEFARPGTKTVGWLGRGHSFPTSPPSDDILDLLWVLCSTSVALQRGVHACEFCPSGSGYLSERNEKRLLLGAAEIRAFSEAGHIYAAPNLIYHYVLVHHYQPPDKFVEALRKGLRPPHREYFECLEKLGLRWNATSSGEGLRQPTRKRSRDGGGSG